MNINIFFTQLMDLFLFYLLIEKIFNFIFAFRFITTTSSVVIWIFVVDVCTDFSVA